MDRQWRPNPNPRPIQGNVNVCPTCLIPHFPSCPHPPAPFIHQPFQGDHSFQAPPPPLPPFHSRTLPYAPRNPNWPPYEHANPNGFLVDGDRNFKRPRIDDSDPNLNCFEDERRLKLIRDHGVALANPPEELHKSYVRPVGLGEGHPLHGEDLASVSGQQQQHHQHKQHNHFQKGFPHIQNGQFNTQPYHRGSYGTSNWDPIQRHAPQPANEPGYSHMGAGLNTTNAHYQEQIGVGDHNKMLPLPHDFHPNARSNNVMLPAHEVNFPSQEGNMTQLNGREVHYPYLYHSENMGQIEGSRFFRGQPPLPTSPPPPLPVDPTINQSGQLKTYFSPPQKPASLFPVPVSSATGAPSSYSQIPEGHHVPQPYFHSKPVTEFSTGFPPEEPSKQYGGDAQPYSLKHLSAEKPKFIDASHLFRHPHKASRPDHFVIILRGLPGSGKSYLAKMLRDLEVENGGDAPRIHSMDDYFMTEVDKVEESEASKSSSSGRNKKPVTKKVMEYCYEPEMEEAYRSSMLKAFKKTVEEGVFTFIIVDDRNLRVADFAQFWAAAKRSGYEVYILEATYKDPVGCAARNVHGFTQEDIEKMAGQWEEAPSLYLQLDMKSLFHGDDLKESRIQEVDMDMEDDLGDALPSVQGREAEEVVDPSVRDDASSLKDGNRWDAEGEHPTEVRELGKSKWSEDIGDDDIDQTEGMKGNINALSGLIHQYGKERKSVHWGDQVGKAGFSIGAARKVNALSLVIGPGAGYNLKSNPLPEEESTNRGVEPKKHSIFEERIRAERESFKAVFDRRKQRIGGLHVEED